MERLYYKNLKKENLRNNMTNFEVAFNILAEGLVTEPPNKVTHNELNNKKSSVTKVAWNQL